MRPCRFVDLDILPLTETAADVIVKEIYLKVLLLTMRHFRKFIRDKGTEEFDLEATHNDVWTGCDPYALIFRDLKASKTPSMPKRD